MKFVLNKHNIFFISLFVISFVFESSNSADLNPYKVLGIPRNADEKLIRNAYRKQAKDWHPDKNKSPEAHEKFMQINQAYEILSDPERRSLYDDYGTINEPRQGGGGYQRESYENFFRDFDGFEGFFGGGGFKFNFNNQRDHGRKSPEEEINKKIYDEIIFPNSHVKPYLIFTYTEFCFSCIAVDNVWQTLKQEIKNLGFGAGHSDASWNRELTRMLGISTVPSIVGVINGRVYHFRGEFTLKNLRDFVRHLIPSRLIIEVKENDFNYTLHQTINDNKVLALFITYSNQVSLRYQIPCFQMVNFIKCASLKLNRMEQSFKEYLRTNFRIEVPDMTSKQEMLILFKENMFNSPLTYALNYKPVLFQVSSEIPFATILQTFELNKHLILPRVSSSQHFFDLCPSWSQYEYDTSMSKNILCSIIVANSGKNSPEFLFDSGLKLKLIKKLNTDELIKQNIQISYIYSDVQNEFIEKISKNSKIKFNENNKSNKIIILKRMDDKYAQFDCLDISLDDLNFYEKLKAELKSYLNGDQKLKYKMMIPNFYEESNQDFLTTVIEHIDQIWNYVTDLYFWERILNNSSYMMVLLCTILFFWLMMMFSSEKSNPNASSFNRNRRENDSSFRREENTPNKYSNSNDSLNRSTKTNRSDNSSCNSTLNEEDLNNSKFDNFNTNTSNQFEVVEMNPKTYPHLITNLPRGYRTVLLILNQENKNQLIDLFTNVCLRYSNKSYRLRFAYLNKNTLAGKKWLDELMYNKYKQIDNENDSDSESKDSNSNDSESDYEQINPKNSIDLNSDCNVLSINNQHKFYTVYNFNTYNSNETSSYLNLKRRNSKFNDISSSMEQSMGFEESYSSQMENKFMSELTIWLDKLTEGLYMNKINVKEWPSFSLN